MSKVTSVVGSFGRLWGRGHESFPPSLRRILSVSGQGATTYLQNLVTSDLLSAPTPPRPESLEDQPGVPRRLQKTAEDYHDQTVNFSDQLRATCFLDPKG
jgi:folate-binding Fe-S cluster repair protein YgfZ